MPDWREHPEMGYEETYGYDKGRVESRDLAIYIKGTAAEQYDYARRMADGRACPSCAEPFPATCELASLHIWRTECPNLFTAMPASEKLIAKGHCPFCQIEVSPAAFNLLVSGLEKVS